MSVGPLHGLKVIDVATLFAAPLAAMLLADFGAEVLKIEHPRGDPARHHGGARDGVSLWWKMFGRNKKATTLNLSTSKGREIFLRLAEGADVVVENFRPGTLERWGLGYDELSRRNPRLVLLRVTAFGQFGPYARRPGFGTLAEAMSGFAAITGQADGPPTLPPFGLADGITGIAAAFATMTALRARDDTGRGQVVDIALIEPIMTVLGIQALVYDQLGLVQKRVGNRSVANAPRNTYLTADGKWLAVSTSSQSVAERLIALVGAPELINEPWFASARGRVQYADLLDSKVAKWMSRHDAADAIRKIEAAEAAVAPVYDIADIFEDQHFQAREIITTVADDELGPLRMQNVLFRLSRDPGRILHAGRPLGADNRSVYIEKLGLNEEEFAAMQADGVI
ncbi:MAG: CoA transferase [Pseudomonadota bacterium]|nr:CoA transferase [Pseudomonadota bacterium]